MNTVLFVCIHNSARSQMAEAFVNRMCPGSVRAESAGLEPGDLNPLVVEVMREIGVDISHHQVKSVNDLLGTGRAFTHVVTVCDGASAERCPVFPGSGERLHWGFPDPSTLGGPREERLAEVRNIRDMIRKRVQQWCDVVCSTSGQVGSAP